MCEIKKIISSMHTSLCPFLCAETIRIKLMFCFLCFFFSLSLFEVDIMQTNVERRMYAGCACARVIIYFTRGFVYRLSLSYCRCWCWCFVVIVIADVANCYWLRGAPAIR